MGESIQIIILIVSILAVAFFSSAEASLISVSKIRTRHLAGQGNKGAQAVNRVVERHDKFFATILLTENAFIILASSLGTALAISLLGDRGSTLVIATVLLTIVIVTFGEITPKSIAAQMATRWSLVVSRPVELIMKVETPLIHLFSLVPSLVFRALGKKVSLQTPTVTEGELRMLIDISQAEGVVERTEAEMLENVFRFGDRRVREVMTPRTEIVWIEKSTPLREFLQIYSEHYHTRFPVYEQTLDNVVGILSAKDVLQNIASGRVSSEDPVTEIIHTPYFVPETKAMDALFAEMRRFGHQMAMVIDEFGGITGLATLKQLIEEVVGSTGEEGTEADREYEAIGENTFQIDGGMNFDQANEELGLRIAKGDYQTVAGFVLDTLGHIPHQGERFSHKNLRLEIIEMKGLKIERVTITITPQRAKKESAETNPEGSKTTP
ncbi:MAG: HlyC/CorC family transporter [Chloroflexi bacterium]|nr:HlyC/CorC family transporter [Chloroflexota bacterium]